MESIITYIYYIGLTSGILLIVLLILSIIAGADSDIDIDLDTDTDISGVDADAGFGLIKSLLTLISISCLSMYSLFIITEWHPVLLVTAAIVLGFVALYVLSLFFRWLMRQQESGNWHLWEALHEKGIVYIPIPPDGKGSIIVKVNGVEREIKAISGSGKAISSKEEVFVSETHEGYVSVIKAK